MKIFFTASYSGKKKYQSAYDKIVNVVTKLDHTLISLEIQNYEDLLGKKLINKISKQFGSKSEARNHIHYAYLMKGIDKADAVIIEASMDKFQLGYEARLALSLNKPVLVLSQDKNYEVRIKDKRFFSKIYSQLSDLRGIIENYFKIVKNNYLSVRLHINISPDTYNFLDWMSSTDRTSKSEIIRGLLEKEKKKRPEYYESIDDIKF